MVRCRTLQCAFPPRWLPSLDRSTSVSPLHVSAVRLPALFDPHSITRVLELVYGLSAAASAPQRRYGAVCDDGGARAGSEGH